ncbi:MAG: hypothetical protein FJ167_06890 [Gammaproteobacteria bacterium]|nr:hypothetical protein [Gammaproteobacteria bacterium]
MNETPCLCVINLGDHRFNEACPQINITPKAFLDIGVFFSLPRLYGGVFLPLKMCWQISVLSESNGKLVSCGCDPIIQRQCELA